MQVRYRYRIYPAPGQQQALARVFGCARVVYNDCLRLRDACHAAGEKISDTEVQRRVITLAKRTPERAWLGEVASVALVQACQDARRAYRNWFDSLSGKRKGRKIGHPGSAASTAGSRSGSPGTGSPCMGTAVRGEGRRYQGRWSRPLPSEPSSVTVIREPDGRYYASFVVERETAPLPACGREIGHRCGPGPAGGHLGRRDHRQSAVPAGERTAPGPGAAGAVPQAERSANRAKARHRVAVLHRKVRETRLDHAHKTALRLVRDNQAVYAEDLAVSGLARTRLAKSVHDAGWAQLLRLVGEKAEHYGRTFPRIGRFVPTSQMCSACGRQGRPQAAARPRLDVRGVRDGPRPGRQRGEEHPGRRAGGQAKRLWRQVRPALAAGTAGEAGTHRGAA